MSSGKGTRSGNYLFLFPVISCPEKEPKVTLVIEFSLLNQYIRKQTIQDGDSQVSRTIDIGQQLNCLHRCDRCLPTCSDSPLIQKVSAIHVRRSCFPIFAKLMVIIAAYDSKPLDNEY